MSFIEDRRFWERMATGEYPDAGVLTVTEYLVIERAAFQGTPDDWVRNPFWDCSFACGPNWWEKEVTVSERAEFIARTGGVGGWGEGVEKRLAEEAFRLVCEKEGFGIDDVAAKPCPRSIGPVRKRAETCAWFCTRATIEDVCDIAFRSKAQVIKDIEDEWWANREYELPYYMCDILAELVPARTREAHWIYTRTGEWPKPSAYCLCYDEREEFRDG